MRLIKPDAVILRSRRVASPLGQVSNPIFSPLFFKTSIEFLKATGSAIAFFF
ncbi:MAG: hypothetical protein ACFCU7_04950 [Pleurocapsa sp.]